MEMISELGIYFMGSFAIGFVLAIAIAASIAMRQRKREDLEWRLELQLNGDDVS